MDGELEHITPPVTTMTGAEALKAEKCLRPLELYSSGSTVLAVARQRLTNK